MLENPQMPAMSTVLDQAHNAIDRKLFMMKGFYHPGGSQSASGVKVEDRAKGVKSCLTHVTKRFRIECHAYCLMDNHYHLIIPTPIRELGRAMRHLNGLYTQRFNRLQGRDGPLFRGRYKAILIDADTDLWAVSR